MSDIASLGLEVDSGPVANARKYLDELTAAGAKTEEQTKRITMAQEHLNFQMAAAKDKAETTAKINARNAATAALVKRIEDQIAAEKQAEATSSAMGDKIESLVLKYASWAAVIGMVTSVLKQMWEQGHEAAIVELRLETTLRAVGTTSGRTMDQLNKLADSLSKTTRFDDTAIKAGMTTMLKFSSVHSETFDQAIRVTSKYAEMSGRSFESSAQQIGRALEAIASGRGSGGLRGLEEQFGKLTSTQRHYIDEQVKLGEVTTAQNYLLDIMNKKLGDIDTEMAGAGVNSVSMFKKAWKELMEELGKPPKEGGVLDWFINKGAQSIANWTRVIKDAGGEAEIATRIRLQGMIDQGIAVPSTHINYDAIVKAGEDAQDELDRMNNAATDRQKVRDTKETQDRLNKEFEAELASAKRTQELRTEEAKKGAAKRAAAAKKLHDELLKSENDTLKAQWDARETASVAEGAAYRRQWNEEQALRKQSAMNDAEAFAARIEASEEAARQIGQIDLKRINDMTKAEKSAFMSLFDEAERQGKAAFVAVMGSGKDAFKAIGTALKTAVIDLMYQLTARKWMLSIGVDLAAAVGVNTTGTGLAGVAGTGTNLFGMAGAAKTGYGWLTGGSAAAGGVGSSVGAAGVMTAAPVYEGGVLVSAGTYAGTTGAAAGGGMMAGIATAAPYIAAAVAAYYLLSSSKDEPPPGYRQENWAVLNKSASGQYGLGSSELPDPGAWAAAVAPLTAALNDPKIFDPANLDKMVGTVVTGAAGTGSAALIDMMTKTLNVSNDAAKALIALNDAMVLAAARRQLDIKLLEAQGKTEEALAAKRKDELAAMDATLQPLQKLINLTEDWALKLSAAAADTISAIDAQVGAAGSAKSSALSMAESYRPISTQLRDASSKIMGSSVAITGASLQSTYSKAMTGDATALAGLPQAATDYLTAAQATSRTARDFARDQAKVVGMLDQAADVSDAMVNWNERQALLLTAQGLVLTDIKTELSKPNPDTEILKRQKELLTTIETMTTGTATATGNLDKLGIKAIFDLSQVITFVANATGIPDDLRVLITEKSKAFSVALQAALDSGTPSTLATLLTTGANDYSATVMAMLAKAGNNPEALKLVYGDVLKVDSSVTALLSHDSSLGVLKIMRDDLKATATISAILANDKSTNGVVNLLNGTAAAKLEVYLSLNAASVAAVTAVTAALNVPIVVNTPAPISTSTNLTLEDIATYNRNHDGAPWSGHGISDDELQYQEYRQGKWGSNAEAWMRLGIAPHASGGLASGWSMVGERGPEVVNFSNPGRVYTSAQTQGMFGSSAANDELVAEVRALRTEVAQLRVSSDKTATHTKKQWDLLRNVTQDGNSIQTVAAA